MLRLKEKYFSESNEDVWFFFLWENSHCKNNKNGSFDLFNVLQVEPWKFFV